jgi:hypothetical protein
MTTQIEAIRTAAQYLRDGAPGRALEVLETQLKRTACQALEAELRTKTTDEHFIYQELESLARSIDEEHLSAMAHHDPVAALNAAMNATYNALTRKPSRE